MKTIQMTVMCVIAVQNVSAGDHLVRGTIKKTNGVTPAFVAKYVDPVSSFEFLAKSLSLNSSHHEKPFCCS